MPAPIGVGIVGLSAGGGWGARGHLGALRALSGYEVRGLTASSAESAARAGREFGIDLALHDVDELARHDAIDLLVVCVRVTEHAHLVESAAEAGKAVLCEWPFARDLAEAERLAGIAEDAGVRTAVGLQARSSPTVRFVRDQVAEGYVGEVLSSTLVGSGGGWSDVTNARLVYTLDRANGATMLTVPFGHTLDAVTSVLGGLADVSATTGVRRPWSTVGETGERVAKTAADQIAVSGTFRSGAVFGAHYRSGSSAGTNFLWEINGTEGDLVLRGPSGHLQFDQATVFGARKGGELQPLDVPPSYQPELPGLDGITRSVANAYALLERDLTEGTRLVPDFGHAVEHHRLLDAIERSADQGVRVRPD